MSVVDSFCGCLSAPVESQFSVTLISLPECSALWLSETCKSKGNSIINYKSISYIHEKPDKCAQVINLVKVMPFHAEPQLFPLSDRCKHIKAIASNIV